jgi:hypothetical protein
MTLASSFLNQFAQGADFELQLLDKIKKSKAISGATVVIKKSGEPPVSLTSSADGKIESPAIFQCIDDSSIILIAKKLATAI